MQQHIIISADMEAVIKSSIIAKAKLGSTNMSTACQVNWCGHDISRGRKLHQRRMSQTFKKSMIR